MPAAMHAQMGDIATVYAENARYPDYAKPLNANDWNLLHPQALVPRQAALANAPGLSATVILDRYILDRNLDQPVQVQLTTEPGTGGSVSVNRVTVWLQQSGKRSAVLTLAGTGQSFQGVLPASSLRSVPAGETAVVAQLELSNGERSNVNAMVRLYEPEARLVRLGDTRVDGADLVIPASFEVSRPGHFRVAANLQRAGQTSDRGAGAVAGEPVRPAEGARRDLAGQAGGRPLCVEGFRYHPHAGCPGRSHRLRFGRRGILCGAGFPARQLQP